MIVAWDWCKSVPELRKIDLYEDKANYRYCQMLENRGFYFVHFLIFIFVRTCMIAAWQHSAAFAPWTVSPSPTPHPAKARSLLRSTTAISPFPVASRPNDICKFIAHHFFRENSSRHRPVNWNFFERKKRPYFELKRATHCVLFSTFLELPFFYRMRG